MKKICLSLAAVVAFAMMGVNQLMAQGACGPLTAPEPLQLDSKTVMAYRRQTEKVMASGHPAERKQLMRAWVQDVKLEPESLAVKISCRLPEAVMKGVVAGAGFEPATFGL